MKKAKEIFLAFLGKFYEKIETELGNAPPTKNNGNYIHIDGVMIKGSWRRKLKNESAEFLHLD